MIRKMTGGTDLRHSDLVSPYYIGGVLVFQRKCFENVLKFTG